MNPKHYGKMYVLEGIDAAGKATQTKRLAEKLRDDGKIVATYSFPDYSTQTGQAIREHLQSKWHAEERKQIGPAPTIEELEKILNSDEPVAEKERRLALQDHRLSKWDALQLQSLYILNRLEAAPNIIKDLRMGKFVICDRYTPSGVVYGGVDGLDQNYLLQVQDVLPKPDLFILIDVTPEISIEHRPDRRDRYEKDKAAMQQRVERYRQLFGFMQASSRWPSWRIVNGRGTIEEVGDKVWACVAETMRTSERLS